METVLAFVVLIVAYLIHRMLYGDDSTNDRLANAGIWFRIKKSVALLYLKYIRLKRKPKDDIYKGPTNDPTVFGIISHKNDWEKELPHSMDKTTKKSDEIAFHGVNSEGACLVVYFTRRPDGVAEIWLYVKFADGQCYTLPKLPTIANYVGTEDTFAAHGLRIKCLSPMRRWRIAFNGLLKSVPATSPLKTSHIKFQLIWNATSPEFDFLNDVHLPFLASAVAGERWKGNLPDLEELRTLLSKYEQCGHMMGTISIDNQMSEVYLWGTRHRRFAMLRSEPSYYDLHLLAVGKYGVTISVGALTIPGVIDDYQYGFVSPGNFVLYPITSSNVSLCQLYLNGHPPTINVAKLKANNRLWKLQVDNFEAKTNIGTTFFSEIQLSSASLNENSAETISIFYHKLRPETVKERFVPRSLTYLEDIRQPKYHFVAPLMDHSTQEMKTLGGKGLSLAKLHAIAQKEKKFHVPKGIIVTYESFKELLTDSGLLAQISKLENVAWGKEKGELKEECLKTAEEIKRCILPDKIKTEIVNQLSKTFGLKYDKIKYAVRSSAAGEDSEELSLAGQMDTFLNITGIEEVFKNIMKCWASQFSHIAVEYKRRNGQELHVPMAVVVQEMVNAQSAGVMFTCDPVTCNPKHIVITSNYGLGESVVSASSEADTICILRDHENNLSVESFEVGSKKTKIVAIESGGVEEIQNNESNQLSISEEQVLKLAEVGVLIEEYFGSSRDIEWAVYEKEIYILQTRPITSIDKENEFEIKHELDGPYKSEDEHYTKANIGEVFPGATSPLSITLVIKMFDIVGQRMNMERKAIPEFVFCPFFSRNMIVCWSHIIFNLIDTLFRFSQEKTTLLSKSSVISLFGRLLENEDELRLRGVERFSKNQHSSIPGLVRMIYLVFDVFGAEGKLKVARDKYSSFKIKLGENASSGDIYKEITRHIHQFSEPAFAHMRCTIASSLWNVAVLSNLASAHKGWTTGVFTDFASLTANIASVESADVPASIDELTVTISQHIDKKKFQAMDVKEAFQWMQNNTSVRKNVMEFFEKHGHRCIKEFDVLSRTWKMDPLKLIKSIQAAVGKPIVSREKQLSTEALLKKIKAPLTPGQKRVLRFVLPRTRRAVCYREASKSLLIRVIDAFRQAFRQLGQAMVREGRLTDEEHLFFFTLEELGIYLETRSPRLLSKAVRRHRAYDELNSVRFPEICFGIPSPLQNKALPQNGALSSGVVMKGTPVSQGLVRGKARVVVNLEEAHTLQQGEILITYCTDIGWSPYFPLLSGLITEMGGLISHGAVVAREYGLPCLVGVHSATEVFRTGDYILLDGDNGVVQKIDEGSISL